MALLKTSQKFIELQKLAQMDFKSIDESTKGDEQVLRRAHQRIQDHIKRALELSGEPLEMPSADQPKDQYFDQLQSITANMEGLEEIKNDIKESLASLIQKQAKPLIQQRPTVFSQIYTVMLPRLFPEIAWEGMDTPSGSVFTWDDPQATIGRYLGGIVSRKRKEQGNREKREKQKKVTFTDLSGGDEDEGTAFDPADTYEPDPSDVAVGNAPHEDNPAEFAASAMRYAADVAEEVIGKIIEELEVKGSSIEKATQKSPTKIRKALSTLLLKLEETSYEELPWVGPTEVAGTSEDRIDAILERIDEAKAHPERFGYFYYMLYQAGYNQQGSFPKMISKAFPLQDMAALEEEKEVIKRDFGMEGTMVSEDLDRDEDLEQAALDHIAWQIGEMIAQKDASGEVDPKSKRITLEEWEAMPEERKRAVARSYITTMNSPVDRRNVENFMDQVLDYYERNVIKRKLSKEEREAIKQFNVGKNKRYYSRSYGDPEPHLQGIGAPDLYGDSVAWLLAELQPEETSARLQAREEQKEKARLKKKQEKERAKLKKKQKKQEESETQEIDDVSTETTSTLSPEQLEAYNEWLERKKQNPYMQEPNPLG